MKNRYLVILFAVLLTINFLLFLPNCSTTDDNDFQLFELDVIIDEGVSGTPIQGTYSYNEGDTVDYSYELLANYRNLAITLDNEAVEPIGTVTITGVHTLRALADPIYDITGSWDLSEEYDDGSSFEVSTTFTGTLENGTVTDTDGGEGVYAVDEYNRVEFNLEFDNINYEYEGLFDDANAMSGSCKKVSDSGTSYGYWSAIRIEQTSPTKTNSRSGKKSDPFPLNQPHFNPDL
jgi:hypothetical protein